MNESADGLTQIRPSARPGGFLGEGLRAITPGMQIGGGCRTGDRGRPQIDIGGVDRPGTALMLFSILSLGSPGDGATNACHPPCVLEHPIAASVELVLRKIPTVLSKAKRSSSHSPHRGRNSTFRDSMSVPQL